MEKNYRYKLYSVMAVIVLVMLIHLEIGIDQQYAPEAVFVQVQETEGLLEENAECYADIISDQINEKKKQLTPLESIYDFVDSDSFFVNMDKGFYLLETGFTDYKDEFEIRIVCYTPELKGVSYTIINNTNQKNCGFKDGGKIVVC